MVTIIKWYYVGFHILLSMDVQLGISFDVRLIECLKIILVFVNVDTAPNGISKMFQ